MISEKIELLGRGLYDGEIPSELTLKSIPTVSELEYVGGEDFDQVMIESILPAAVEESIDFNKLLEIDYHWICRALRILNYGPYHTTNTIYCSECGNRSYGEFQVNLNTLGCKPLPEDFVNEITISKTEFVDFDGDVTLKLPTIRDITNAYKDKAFIAKNGKTNRELARLCYTIKSIRNRTDLTPIDVKMILQNEFSSADYIILKNLVSDRADYGLRIGGTAQCPKCGKMAGTFIAFVDDRFFRPTVGNLQQWKYDRSAGKAKDIPRGKTAAV